MEARFQLCWKDIQDWETTSREHYILCKYQIRTESPRCTNTHVKGLLSRVLSAGVLSTGCLLISRKWVFVKAPLYSSKPC